jgi:hypothetical protein
MEEKNIEIGESNETYFNQSILNVNYNKLEGGDDEDKEMINDNKENYFCYICYDHNSNNNGYKLSCSHIYCKECLYNYINSKVCDGQVYPRCFHPMTLDIDIDIDIERDTNRDGIRYNSNTIDYIDSLRNKEKSSIIANPDISNIENNVEGNNIMVIDDKLNNSHNQSISNSNNIINEQPQMSITSNITFFTQSIVNAFNPQVSMTPPHQPLTRTSSSSSSSSSTTKNDYTNIRNLQNESHNIIINKANCDINISKNDIKYIIKDNEELNKKYDKFIFSKENINVRECPECDTQQICTPAANNPIITCNNCSFNYCYIHGGAHSSSTCEAYLLLVGNEFLLSEEVIKSQSKPCPGCGTSISKSGGCNHMKCPQCNAAFCWLCGSQIDDVVFPPHFQWWSGSKCSNLQMNEAIEPTRWVLFVARLTSICELVLLGFDVFI